MLRTVLLLDGSDAMNSSSDYLPNYLLAMRPPLLRLVERYLDSTPLASLGVVVMRDGISHRLLPCTTNRNEIVDVLERDVFLHGGSGSTSMENGLRMAMSELVDMREVAALAAATAKKSSSFAARNPRAAWKGSATQLNVIVLTASVTLIDPTDVFAVVNIMAALSIRISVVSLVGAVHVFDVCTVETGGTLYCPLNYDHLLHIMDELSTAHRAQAAMARKKRHQRGGRQQRVKRCREEDVEGVEVNDDDSDGADAPYLIPIGCPVYLEAPLSDSAEPSSAASSRSFYLGCPQCHLIQLTVPTTCSMCRLLLCSAPMLYSTFVLHNCLVPPAKVLRVMRDASPPASKAANLSAAATATVQEGGVVKATMQQPIRCGLCMTSFIAEMMGHTRNGGVSSPVGSSAREALVVDGAQVWQCSACASYRCNACNDFVLHTIGLCPYCLALQ
ncbi:Ssl1-like [Leishmania donovani]|uniref:Ssl1-like_putative/Pfam:PF04056 n=1 Tax=Leishmania donovani TaxID=5661 RepID=A0A6J8FBK3_LEIDO|nr:Ssl1-like [Leishmania donovani]VDZ45120.1 Ssl1-like_putative/Pfam:PF04056 [Leishmania donovani]